MAISQFPPQGGTSGSSDFSLTVGTSGNTSYTLNKTYPAGVYSIGRAFDDATYDVYAVGTNNSYVGYSNSDIINISEEFSKIVILGADSGETFTFSYNGLSSTPTGLGDVPAAGAFVSSVVTSSLPNIDDTTVINGGNFANDVEITFIDQSNNESSAKSIVVNSSTEILVTRPDVLTPGDSPYSIRAENPGIPSPTSTNAHVLTNSITAGTSPSWVTDGSIFYNISEQTAITLLATDTEGSDIDYSVVSGSLPAGLSLDSETGVISGTFSGSAAEGDTSSVTFRATDAGGNFVDKTLSVVANTAVSWTTPAGAIDPGSPDSPYSFQLQAEAGTSATSLTYTLESGSLPAGTTLSSSGLISGTVTEADGTTSNFDITVSDTAFSVTRSFSIETVNPDIIGGSEQEDQNYIYNIFTSSQSIEVVGSPEVDILLVAGGGGGSGIDDGGQLNHEPGSGGGGAGGVLVLTGHTLTAGTSNVSIGGGGSAASKNFGNKGSSTNAFGQTLEGGGRSGKGEWYGPYNNTINAAHGGNGGSGGGAGGNADRAASGGNASAGNPGGSSSAKDAGGGGGGAGNSGGSPSGISNNGLASNAGNGGNGIGFTSPVGNVFGGGGGGGHRYSGPNNNQGGSPGSGGGGDPKNSSPGGINTGGGGSGRGLYINSSAGGSGIVIVRRAK